MPSFRYRRRALDGDFINVKGASEVKVIVDHGYRFVPHEGQSDTPTRSSALWPRYSDGSYGGLRSSSEAPQCQAPFEMDITCVQRNSHQQGQSPYHHSGSQWAPGQSQPRSLARATWKTQRRIREAQTNIAGLQDQIGSLQLSINAVYCKVIFAEPHDASGEVRFELWGDRSFLLSNIKSKQEEVDRLQSKIYMLQNEVYWEPRRG
jgi:hypothetical protein